MPSLKFSRDRRGYESTYLVHASRQAGTTRLLYWFRSPPHVKIGRAAFDEDAIRLIEQQNPDVEFDWDRILTARPPAAPESRDPREPRTRGRENRRPMREPRRDAPGGRPGPPGPKPPSTVGSGPVGGTAPQTSPPPADAMPVADVAGPSGSAAPDDVTPSLVAPTIRSAVPPAVPIRRFVRVLDTPAHHATDPPAVERLLGAEQLTLLRARYAEILARISARGGDPARVEALREQAERVNPDGWVTEADVRAGLAAVDATLAELHRIVGRRRRRRRRRGGAGAGEEAAAADPGGAQSRLEAPGAPGDDGEDAEEEGADEDGEDEGRED